jgi:hypothetical protein
MHHEQMNMEANDLFIRCNDAIFSASTIRAQTVKMLVSGNLTVETLTDTFRSSSHSSQIAGSLSSIAGLIKGVPTERRFIDPRLGAVPTIRIADEERLTDNIDRAAALIGKEVFYLKVGELLYNKGGMISDGAIAGRRVYESVPTRDERHKRVINPMIGELVSMMGQVEEFNEVRAQYMLQRKVDGATSKQIETEMKQVEPDIREKTISEIRQKLTEEGATPAEIQQILQNDQMNKLLDSSKAAVTQQQLLGIRVKSIGGRKVGDSYHEKTEDTLLAKSSKMFVDAACYIDDFATENPRIAKFALTAASVAIGGPTRFVGHYVTEKSGITAKIEQAEDKVKEWSVDQFIEKFRMDEDTAELLASGIVFGAQITTAVLGARSAGKVLKDAKKISVHKNSLDYVGDTHVYKIKNVTKGVDHKIGESAQGLNKHGLSKRAEQQAKRLRKETGEDFKSEILEWHHGKRSARASETRLIRQAKGKDPDALPGNKGVH